MKKNDSSLLEVLREEGHFLPAWCGGKGTCGKCKVQFLSECPPATEKDRLIFKEGELTEGWRLACMVRGQGPWELMVPDYKEEEIDTADSFSMENTAGRPSVREDSAGYSYAEKEPDSDHWIQGGQDRINDNDLILAIDIGTTTIAACLVDAKEGRDIRTVTGINHQRAYGADVLSRIDAANKGKGDQLKDLVTKDLDHLCEKLGLGNHIEDLTIPVMISGNTTMEHLLEGLSCRTLGVYPFDAVDLSMHTYKNMTILPGISTYVGADIVSGIVACGIDLKEGISILVDLGTNGEMIIGNRHRILAASTAAGPAFEGGNISCGMAGVPGAIDSVTIKDGKAVVTTIGGQAPVGVCGTGVLETVYELLKEEIMDETGLLCDEYFDRGYPVTDRISFLAKDIRQVQLAKAAIRAGIEILLLSYGVSYDQIDRLYLAGGFGQKMDCRKALGIGIIPKALSDRVLAVGNSSLEGAKLLAKDPSAAGRFLHVVEISEEISLSNHKRFSDLFVNSMFFE